ncbi:EIN3-binding F-box protein 1 [Glycine max]|nr:EIN3-binding F-box protein 1 [Glycine max]
MNLQEVVMMHDDVVLCVYFSRDSEMLAFESEDRKIKVSNTCLHLRLHELTFRRDSCVLDFVHFYIFRWWYFMKNCEVATTLGSGEITYFVLLPPFYNIGHYGKAITNLVLSGLKDVTGRGVMGAAQVPLTVTSCKGLTNTCIEAIGKGCINLNGSVAFAKASVSLENLLLEECNRFTLTRIIVALVNIKMKLKSLSLVKYMGVKDIDMEVSILSPCESFQSLVIQKCPGFGSASLAMIVQINCEAGLVNVNLTGFWNLTNNIVSTLAWLYGGKLEVLNLDGCGKITNASLVVIANNFIVLNDLDVSN